MVYTAARLLLFAAALVLLALFGLRGFPLLILALLVSGLVSVVLLARQRAAVARGLQNRMARRHVDSDDETGTPDGAD